MQRVMCRFDSGSVAGAATALGVSRLALSALLERSSRSVRHDGVADRKAFGVRMDTLMRMQASYDIARARRRENVRVARYVPVESARGR